LGDWPLDRAVQKTEYHCAGQDEAKDSGGYTGRGGVGILNLISF